MSSLSPEVIRALQQMSVGAPQQQPAPQPAAPQMMPQQPIAPMQAPATVSPALSRPEPAQQPQPTQQTPQQEAPQGGLSPYLAAGLGGIEAANRQGAGAMKSAENDLNKAGEAQKLAIQEKAKAQAETAKGLALHDEAIATLQDRHQQEQNALRDEIARKNDAQLGVVQKAQQHYATDVANQTNFWGDKNVAQKVGWAIATALGGFGAAATRTQNGAMQMLQEAIADDTRLKERKLAGEREGINNEQNTLGMLRQSGLDQQQALAANQLLGLQAARTRLQAYVDGRQGPEAAANAKALMAQIDEQMANKKVEIANMTQQRQAQYAAGVSHVLGTQAELDDRKAQRDYDLVMAGIKAKNGEAHIPGDIGFTTPKTADEGKALGERAYGARAAIEDVDRLKNMFGVTDANGNYHFQGRTPAAVELLKNGGYEQAVERLVRNKMKADGDGSRMSPEMVSNAKKQLGLPESASGFLAAPERYLKLLDRYRDATKNTVVTYARGIGVKPVNDTWWDLDSVDHMQGLK